MRKEKRKAVRIRQNLSGSAIPFLTTPDEKRPFPDKKKVVNH